MNSTQFKKSMDYNNFGVSRINKPKERVSRS